MNLAKSKPIISKSMRQMIDRADTLKCFMELCAKHGVVADNGIIAEYESIMAILRAYSSAVLSKGITF